MTKQGLLAFSLSLSPCFLFLKVASRLVPSLVSASLEAIVSVHECADDNVGQAQRVKSMPIYT